MFDSGNGMFGVVSRVSFVLHECGMKNKNFNAGLIWPENALPDVWCVPCVTCGEPQMGLLPFFFPFFHKDQHFKLGNNKPGFGQSEVSVCGSLPLHEIGSYRRR
ncbi:hypothetical protein ILYODFUR_037661 [Ilyodon furcidens]|uniref:Uncharacterized protein n=1 Tax=Ilyodon furcidens TaxID=33524 RepID=A0ABV0V0N6_9TELE